MYSIDPTTQRNSKTQDFPTLTGYHNIFFPLLAPTRFSNLTGPHKNPPPYWPPQDFQTSPAPTRFPKLTGLHKIPLPHWPPQNFPTLTGPHNNPPPHWPQQDCPILTGHHKIPPPHWRQQNSPPRRPVEQDIYPRIFYQHKTVLNKYCRCSDHPPHHLRSKCAPLVEPNILRPEN